MPPTKIPNAVARWLLSVVFLTVLIAGCTPSGPKALLQGERLIHEGKYAEAIERLKIAVLLLPDNGQAWNHLGIALHSSGQMNEASRVYRGALRRNPNLTAAHFNLGVLALDQNDAPTAVSELTTYTVLQRESNEGWLKLATAQLRARQLDGAEKSFQTALRLKPGLAEALNGLGVIHSQRRHVREAVTFFSNALKAQPDYAPALLNLGVVTQSFDRRNALQHYRGYLALCPTAPNAAAVREMIQQIESESAAAVRGSATNTVASVGRPLALTNTITARAPALGPPTTPPASNTQPIAVTRNIPPPANSLATGVVALTRAPVSSPKGIEQPTLAHTAPKPDGSVRGPAAVPNRELSTPKPQEVNVPQDRAPQPPVDVASVPPSRLLEAPARPENIESASEARQNNGTSSNLTRAPATEEKRSFPRRLNPTTWFRANNKPAPITTPLDPNPRGRSTTVPPSTDSLKEKPLVKSEAGTPTTVSSASRGIPAVSPPSQEQPAAPPVPRYSYLSPAKPAAGDRARAEQALARGVLAHGQRELSAALNAYRESARLDPSLFEAQYNLGLAAYELKDWPVSLSSYETALSINPTSANARFNFALALDRAGYSLDSAAQLEKILTENPKEVRAHFSVAKIYAEQLKQTDSAARHYQQLLELDPQHPQAAAIRQWLVAHAAR